MIAIVLGLWRYGLAAALLVSLGLWHMADKSKAVELIRAEYVAAALVASESARIKEQLLVKQNQKVANDFAIQKNRNASAAVVSAGQLRDLQAALDTASAASANSTTSARTDATLARITGECAVALAAMDATAREYFSVATALQQYADSLRVKD
jgi:hypothetical protein